MFLDYLNSLILLESGRREEVGKENLPFVSTQYIFWDIRTGRSLGQMGRSLGQTGRSLGQTGRSLGQTGRGLGQIDRS